MSKGRLEAFSDGVMAVIITIMVLEIKVPPGHDWSALVPLIEKFLSYAMSFLYVGIYWNNHHHLLKAAKGVTGKIMWLNLLFLFFLSLIPFVTAWLGESSFAAPPAALYSIALLLCGLSYFWLQWAIICQWGYQSTLYEAIGRDHKGKISLAVYVIAILLAFAQFAEIACLLNALVAMMWLIPDQRVEKALSDSDS